MFTGGAGGVINPGGSVSELSAKPIFTPIWHQGSRAKFFKLG